MINVICFSGGKDSTTLLLWARRALLRPYVDSYRVIFCDTGWEHQLTLDYVEYVSTKLDIQIEHLRGRETFEDRVRRLRGFPSSGKRWCTDELKIQPTARYLDKLRAETGDEVQVLTGIRAEESRARSRMPEREWFDAYDCEQWRPLIAWTLEQVIAEHHLAGLELNPLYKLGAERVGCWPCINAGKTEIELVARLDPGRIDRIRAMEAMTKNTMFSKEAPVRLRVPGEKRHELPLPIDEAVAWSRTARGGQQIQPVRPKTGCFRWGTCEAPTDDKEPA